MLTQPLGLVTFAAAQIARMAHSAAWPSLTNQDPAGVFGDPSKPTLRLVVIGDSSVTAPGVQPLDGCWVRHAARSLAQEYHVELINHAAGGAKIADVLREQIGPALADSPHMLLISIGGNDALRGTPLRRFEDDYERIADMASGIPTAIAGIGNFGSIPRLPTFAKSIASVRSRSINNAITRVAVNHPHIVKANARHPRFDKFFSDPDRYFAADHFHLSAEGHRLIAEAWDEIMPDLVAMYKAT